MTIKVLFFAHYQDVVGVREMMVSLEDGANAASLAAMLEAQHPKLGRLLEQGRVAVDAEFAEASTVLHDGAEVAWMPPVSGG